MKTPPLRPLPILTATAAAVALLLSLTLSGESKPGYNPGNLRVDFVNTSGHDVWLTIIGSDTTPGTALTNGPVFFSTNRLLGLAAADLKNAPFRIKASDTNSTFFVSPVPESGRVFMCLDHPTPGFQIVTNKSGVVGMSQPTLSNPSLTPYESQWQFFEMSWQTNAATGVASTFMNISYVDMFHLPYTMKENATGSMSGINTARKAALDKISPLFKDGWEMCVITNGSFAGPGTQISLISSPGDTLAVVQGWPSSTNLMNKSGFTGLISNIWFNNKYPTVSTDCSEIANTAATPCPVGLMITGTFANITSSTPGWIWGPPLNCPNWGQSLIFTNAVTLANRKTNPYPTLAAGPMSIGVPGLSGVMGCADALEPVNKTVQSIFCREIAAALNTGVFPKDGAFTKAWWSNDARPKLYQTMPYNMYAKAIHQLLYENKGYAFAFDDVCGLDGSFGEVRNGTDKTDGVTVTIYDCTDWKATSMKSGAPKGDSPSGKVPPPKVDGF